MRPASTGTMNKVVMVKEMVVICWFGNTNLQSSRLTCSYLLLSARYASSRNQHSPRMDTRTWWQPDYIGPLPPWKGQRFILTGVISFILTYSGYRFVFLECNVSAKTIIRGVTECLVHHHIIPHYYFSLSMTVGPRSWNSLVLPCFPPSSSSCFDRKMECSFESKLQYQLGVSKSGSLGKHFLEGDTYFKHLSTVWYVFSLARIYRSRS